MAESKKTKCKTDEEVKVVDEGRAVEEVKEKLYIVTAPNKEYCGIGAGGANFAYGQAEMAEGWLLRWYREKGYKVTKKK